ncbi:MAG: hypothetical protein NZ608_02095 [candidate division WOR-3 bacterium]|nr:hypothetical protein [candidate division WOR-3 bacterium]
MGRGFKKVAQYFLLFSFTCTSASDTVSGKLLFSVLSTMIIAHTIGARLGHKTMVPSGKITVGPSPKTAIDLFFAFRKEGVTKITNILKYIHFKII